MPPKHNDEYPSDDEPVEDDFSEDDEVDDPDYQEEHHAEAEVKKGRVIKDDDDDADEDDADEDDADDDKDEIAEVDIDFGIGDEDGGGDEIDPPRPDISKMRRVVAPDLRETSERMSLFEVARVLGDRARHIDNKARPNIDTKNCTGSLEIAYMELMQRRIPFAIIRKVGQGWVEVWRCREMIIPKLPPIEYFTTKVN